MLLVQDIIHIIVLHHPVLASLNINVRVPDGIPEENENVPSVHRTSVADPLLATTDKSFERHNI